MVTKGIYTFIGNTPIESYPNTEVVFLSTKLPGSKLHVIGKDILTGNTYFSGIIPTTPADQDEYSKVYIIDNAIDIIAVNTNFIQVDYHHFEIDAEGNYVTVVDTQVRFTKK